MWEIVSRGRTPYPGVQNCELLDLLLSGHRLRPPSDCDHKLWVFYFIYWSDTTQILINRIQNWRECYVFIGIWRLCYYGFFFQIWNVYYSLPGDVNGKNMLIRRSIENRLSACGLALSKVLNNFVRQIKKKNLHFSSWLRDWLHLLNYKSSVAFLISMSQT